MLNEIKKSIISGILISIGGCVYLASVYSGMPWLGAILFSGGLLAICIYGFNLYTGKVGYIAFHFKDIKYIGFVAQICLFNILTTFILGVLVGKYFPNIRETAVKVYTAKLATPYGKDLVSSIFCGMLMYLAVDTWKQGQKAGLFIYVPLFIIAGFDHSIANSFYNGAALDSYTWTLNNLWFVLIVIAGNAIGGMTLPLLTRKWKEVK
ncbi:MAG: formate/nitrite transporter family protein [Treponema sp.]|nr:formate/nitrite transporter family protein [Treponema sp.]